jgi:hypothetical protein
VSQGKRSKISVFDKLIAVFSGENSGSKMYLIMIEEQKTMKATIQD